MKKYFCLLLGVMGAQCAVWAQETASLQQTQYLDSVYIDAKIPLDRKQSGKTVTVITKEQLSQNQGVSVAQLLNQIAGFEINGAQSNNGQNLGYFVRGGRNRQVLVVVDGVPLNDASQISNDYDLRLLSTDNVERIEILKGASSVLYGSGAATAVISITTQKEKNKPFHMKATSLVGTDRATEESKYAVASLQNNFSVGGSLKHFFYDASVSHRFSDGMSAIAAPEGATPFEADTFNAFNSRLNFGVKLNDQIQFSQFITFDRIKNGFDDFSYIDADYTSSSKQFRTGGNFEWSYRKGAVLFNDSYTLLEREIASSFPAKYDSKVYSFDTYWQHQWTSWLRSVVGLNGNLSEMNSSTIPYAKTDFVQIVEEDTANFSYYDPYLNFVFSSDLGLSLNAGARLNLHSVYDSHWVFQVNPSYYRKLNTVGIKVMASYSTAYITPSLFQIFDPIYGNENLVPEENTSLEGGVEISHEKGFRMSFLYFQREEKQFIDFMLTDPELYLYQYQNVIEAFEVNGVEVEFSMPLSTRMNLRGNYTYTKRDDRFSLRIPEHKANAFLEYQLSEKTYLGLQFQYVSEREDAFFNPTTFENESVTLASYNQIHFQGSTQLTKNLKAILSLRNIFDTEFEELYRYQTRGRSIQLGLQVSL